MEPYVILALAAIAFYGIAAILYNLSSSHMDPVTLILIVSVAMSLTVFVF